MKYIEKHPMIMIVIGIMGISLSAIFVRYSNAPSAVTAAYRLLWTVAFLTPVVFGKKEVRRGLKSIEKKMAAFSILSGLFLAIHFVFWFESLKHTAVASSTTIVCTEVIWVCLGFCLFLKGKLQRKAILAIGVTLGGSVLIAWADSGSGAHLYGDILALLSAVAVGIYTLIGRIVREKVSTTVYTYLVYTACAVVLVATSLAQRDSLVGFGLSPVIVGILLALFYFSPAFVSASKLCEPVVAAIFASFLFGEIPTVMQILGSILILGGVLWYSAIENQKSTS